MLLNAWDDHLIALDDIVEPEKSRYPPTALSCCYHYNNTIRKRSNYMVPMKLGISPFQSWRPLVGKAGYKVSEIPNTWNAFLDFTSRHGHAIRCAGRQRVPVILIFSSTTGRDVDHERTVLS
jgi:hypothetical protein